MAELPLDHTLLAARLRRAANDEAALRTMIPYAADGTPLRTLKPAPDLPPPRQGAVLVLLYQAGNDWHIPLTVRQAALRQHSGEISLPGGRYDETDGTLERTALREAWEELGILPDQVEVITNLTPVWIPVSNFMVLPVVGFARERPNFQPASGEVALLIEASLHSLMQPSTRQQTTRLIRGQELHIPFFAVADHEVWGATALVLAQLVSRMEREELRIEN